TMLNNVDFPHPDGPITPRNSPGATVSERLSTAVSAPSGVSNRLTMFSTTRMASAGRTPAACPSLRGKVVDTGMDVVRCARLLLRLPRHRGGKRRGVARLHPHVDDRHMALLDRGNRFRERRPEVGHLGDRSEAERALGARDTGHVDVRVADALADPAILHRPVADAGDPLLVQLVIEE